MMFSWFLSKTGRVFTHFSIGVAAASTFAYPVLLHGPFLNTLQSIFELQHNGKPKPIDPEVLKVAEEVLNDCNIDKEKTKFFNVVGKDVFVGGSKTSPYGIIIGLPFTFESTPKNFTDLRFVGMGDSQDWIFECPELIDTFSLPKEAQKFAIAQGIYSTDMTYRLEKSAIASLCWLVIPSLAIKHINYKYHTYKLLFKRRMLMYTFIYACGILLYNCLKNPTEHIRYKRCYEKIASLGSTYIDGGIMFYENMLTQNKEFRKLFKKKGESMYTEAGDLNYWVFAPKLPITKSLEYFQKLKNTNPKT